MVPRIRFRCMLGQSFVVGHENLLPNRSTDLLVYNLSLHLIRRYKLFVAEIVS